MRSHYWTVAPRLGMRLRRPQGNGASWQTVVVDPQRGDVPLFGAFHAAGERGVAAVLVHGLGGSPASPYLVATAAACERAGIATLVLGLRGSDGRAGDFYHGGLTSDVAAALASPELAGYERVFVVGFSLGGHVVLRYATEEHDARLAGVAAVCSPLELRPAQESFDRLPSLPYRMYVLGRLKRVYAEIARHGSVPTPVDRMMRVRKLREWDALTVVPRFGFESPEDYYSQASVGARLRRLDVPALLVACPTDPMVPAASIGPAAAAAGDALDLRWVKRGGHVGFPESLDLGMSGPPGLPGQLAGWLGARAEEGLYNRRSYAKIP